MYKQHDAFFSHTGHIDSRTRVRGGVVRVGGKDLQTAGLSDEVVRVGVGRQTNAVLCPRDLRAGVPRDVTRQDDGLARGHRYFGGRVGYRRSHYTT